MALGIVTPRRIGEPLALGVAAAKAEFGAGVLNPANTFRETIEAVGALPWDLREQDMVNLAIQFDPRKSTGEFLEAALWPLAKRQQPKAAAGTVILHYASIVTTPTPFFAAGDLEFLDGNGVRFIGTDDMDPPTTILDNSAIYGTFSETLGSGNTKIAQKVSISDTDIPQAIRIQMTDVLTGTPVVTVSIVGDSAGDPLTAPATDRLELTGVELADGTNDFIFLLGDRVTTGDYWIVIEVTSGGTVRFDGGTGGTANQVKFYNGSVWANSTSVENLNIQLYNAGEFPVVAAQLGEVGNIEAGALSSVRPNSGAAQTRYETYVSSFENLEAFEGGQDLEDDEDLRSRAHKQSAARGTSSPGGLVFGLQDGTVPGITFVDLLENDSMDWGTDEPILNNSTKTGAAGDLIDGATYYRTAQRFEVVGRRSASAFAFKLNADTASTITFRIEADTLGTGAGDPDGTALFEKTGVVPAGTTRVSVGLPDPGFLEDGWYWLVATRTAGSFRFDGLNSGGTDNVKRYTGAVWQLSSALEDMNVEIYGGTPPKSFQIFVEGGSDDDVAQGIYDLRAPGIATYGSSEGTALDFAGRDVTQYFSRPTNVDIVLDVEVQYTADFTGTEDDIRDLITEYRAELGIGDTFVRQEAMGRLTGEGDARTIGVYDVVKFRLGKKSAFATPAALTSAEVTNLTLNFGERFRIADPATDIAVTLTAAPV